MKATTSAIVYLTPSTKAELDGLYDILEPHSWSEGEFGLMLTDAAFVECVESLSPRTCKALRGSLRSAVRRVRNGCVGDVCLNFGLED
jgi:hypothetical protein